MLKSGNCLSHLNIIKIKKSYIIKVYIYSIDLEKLSYDFINKIYNLYYTTLKIYTGKISGVTKNVLKAKLTKKRFINELQNSDLFAFIFIYYFFESFVKINHNKQYLKQNIFSINLNTLYSDHLIKRYFNYIIFKLKFFSVRRNSRRLMPKFVRKRKLLRFFKVIEQKKRKSLMRSFGLLNLKKIKQLDELLKAKTSNKVLNKEDKAYLAYFKKVFINKNY